jgi:hypothetical protein
MIPIGAHASLIYFEQASFEDDLERFPITPEETVVTALVHMRLEAVLNGEWNILDTKRYDPMQMLSSENAKDFIVNAVRDVTSQNTVKNDAYSVYSVHPKSVLLRLFRWGLLRTYTLDEITNTFNELAKKTVDLCEAFHYPATLTFEQRKNFNTKFVADWLGAPNLETGHVLPSLARTLA